MIPEYDIEAIPVLITSGISTILAILISATATAKLREKKNKIALTLCGAMYSATIGLAYTFLAQVDWFLTMYYPHTPYIYSYGGGTTYSFIAGAIVCLTQFAIYVFKWKKWYIWLSLAMAIVVIIISWHPYNWWGQIPDPGAPNIRPISSIITLLYSGVVVVRIGFGAYSAAKVASSEVIRDNFKDILKAMILIFLTFILQIMDNIVWAITGWKYNPVRWFSMWPLTFGLFFLYRGFFGRKVQ